MFKAYMNSDKHKSNKTEHKGKKSHSLALLISDSWFIKCYRNLEKEEMTFSWKYQECMLCEENAVRFS